MAESELSPEAQAQTQVAEPDAFTSLLHKEFKPRTDRARESVEQAVHTLAQQALS